MFTLGINIQNLSKAIVKSSVNIDNRVYHENMFFKNKISTTHHASAMGLIQGDPKGFLISTTFKGS